MTDFYGHSTIGCESGIVRTVQTNQTVAGIPLTAEIVRVLDQGLIEKINHQNEIIDQLIKRDEERKEVFMQREVENLKKNKEIIDLKNRIAELEKNIHEDINEYFAYMLDTRTFKDKEGHHPNKEWLINMWDGMYDLANAYDDQGIAILKNATYLAPVYTVITTDDKLKYKFTGKRSDFEYFWNENVANRIKDSKRRNKITCKSSSLSANLNNDCWKNTKAIEWYTKKDEGGDYADYYQKAWVIKEHIESFAK